MSDSPACACWPDAMTSWWKTHPEMVVVLAGVSAALHVGKLSPALPVLQEVMDMSLLQAGFLLSLVQLAGVLLGLAVCLGADGLGLRRSMLAGLLVLSLASFAGGASGSVEALLAWRAVEGVGFLLASMPAPGLIRRLVPAHRMRRVLGLWGAYMPLGTSLALISGPVVLQAFGWQYWWWLPAAASLLMALALWHAVAPDSPAGASPSGGRAEVSQANDNWMARLRRTVCARGPWLVALAFAVYSSQWLAVIGFLPSVLAESGFAATAVAWPLALAAAVNMIGNIASGRLMEYGVPPAWLLAAGYLAMALGAWIAFDGYSGGATPDVAWRYAGVLGFSMLGGMIPGTLFSLAVAVSTDEASVSTTVGWMQQWSSMGQFAGPPLVAWVAHQAGGWQWTWCVTGLLAMAGLAATGLLAKEVRR
ncbi:MAG: MFS transporter [Burkholderiaceae bacterium]